MDIVVSGATGGGSVIHIAKGLTKKNTLKEDKLPYKGQVSNTPGHAPSYGKGLAPFAIGGPPVP
jgi:hypothetical protein